MREEIECDDLRELEEEDPPAKDDEVATPYVRDVDIVAGVEVCAPGQGLFTGARAEQGASLVGTDGRPNSALGVSRDSQLERGDYAYGYLVMSPTLRGVTYEPSQVNYRQTVSFSVKDNERCTHVYTTELITHERTVS